MMSPLSSLSRIGVLVRARNIEYFRDRSTFGWNFLFPVLLVVVLFFAFQGGQSLDYKVGIDRGPGDEPLPFLELPFVDVSILEDLSLAQTRVQRHSLGLLISMEQGKYWINPDSAHGFYLEQALVRHMGQWSLERSELGGKAVRYIDWVIPGVLAMNILFSTLWGIGYVIVRYRRYGVLKRLSATPARAYEFLAAQMISRLWVVLASNLIIFLGLDFFLDFRVVGSYFDLFIIFVVGSLCLMSIALLVASRVRSDELAGGLLNVLSWPMMFVSGLWFPIEDGSPGLIAFSKILPLTHVTSAARSVMLDGLPLSALGFEIGALALTTVVALALGSWLFRWQ